MSSIKDSKIVSRVVGQRQAETPLLNRGERICKRGAKLSVTELRISDKSDRALRRSEEARCC